MAIHSIVRALPYASRFSAPFSAPKSRRTLLDVPQPRRLTLIGEANVYLRRRRAQWKSAAIAFAVASAWLGVCAILVSRLG